MHIIETPSMNHDSLQHTSNRPPVDITDENLALVGDAITGITTNPHSEQSKAEEEREVMKFVGGLDENEIIISHYAKWFEAASKQHPDIASTSGIAQRLASLATTPHEADAPELTRTEVARRFETDGYVEMPPKFKSMVNDTSRNTMFTYDRQSSYDRTSERGKKTSTMTEHEGLKELDDLLGTAIIRAGRPSASSKDRRLPGIGEQAKSIRNSLTFIGEPEYEKAIAGIAASWQSYLVEDPTRQILLAPDIDVNGRVRTVKKSSDHVTASVLAKLRGDDDGQLADRVFYRMQDVTAAPKDTRVIILDDWMVTGQQMDGRCNRLLRRAEMQKYRDSVEINLIAASKDRINNGFTVDGAEKPIKVRAYYRAHQAHNAEEKVKNASAACHITGLHSTVNFGFATTVENMVTTLNAHTIGNRSRIQMPALASVYRPYWQGSAMPDRAVALAGA